MITYSELEGRYGGVIAYHLLTEMEKAAGVRAYDGDGVDYDLRAERAQFMQDQQAA